MVDYKFSRLYLVTNNLDWEGRIVAIAGDCKSPPFEVQRFESSSSHYPNLSGNETLMLL